MQMEFIRKLPTPQEIKNQYPVTLEMKQLKQERDEEIRDILSGKSDKFILVIGPCSADNEDAVLEYMHKLKDLQEKVKDKIFMIPRVYTNKPRTVGKGYKGMLHQPDPQGEEDMLAGIIAIRHMHKRVVQETGFTCAEEMLYPQNHRYLSDLLSYIAIGARSVENQEHRLVTSGAGIPTGMKNPTGGDLTVMMNSIVAAQAPAKFIYPNYHYETLKKVYDLYQERGLANPSVIVDTNHANSGKKYLEQIRIAKDVLHSRRQSEEIKSLVKGLMIESYLEDGCQSVDEGVFGKSITDPCLGWEKTEKLVLDIAELL